MFSLFLQLNDLNEALTQQRVVSHLLNIRNKHLQEEMEERFEESSSKAKKKKNKLCGNKDDDDNDDGEGILLRGKRVGNEFRNVSFVSFFFFFF